MNQFGVGIERQHGACLLRLAPCPDEVHVGALCGGVGEEPVLYVGRLARGHLSCQFHQLVAGYVNVAAGHGLGRVALWQRCHKQGQVNANLIVELILRIVAIAGRLLGHRVGAVAVELARDGDLGGEMHGDAALVVGCGLAEPSEVVHPLVLRQHPEVGGDVGHTVYDMGTRELVVAVAGVGCGLVGQRALCGHTQAHRSMLEHGQVATLQHALHEGARRVGRAVVLTLVAHAAHTFYLSVNAVYAWALWPYLELGLYNFHAYRFCRMQR